MFLRPAVRGPNLLRLTTAARGLHASVVLANANRPVAPPPSWNPIRFVKYMMALENYEKTRAGPPPLAVASVLVDSIKDQPELLYLLLRIHYELASIGITRSSSTAGLWKYLFLYVTRLKIMHEDFWSTCRLLEISKRTQRLGLLPDKIGVLDPANFSEEVYDALQKGKLGDVDFRYVEYFGPKQFKGQ